MGAGGPGKVRAFPGLRVETRGTQGRADGELRARRGWLAFVDDADVELFKLLLSDRGGGVGHEVDGFGGLGERAEKSEFYRLWNGTGGYLNGMSTSA